MSLIDSLIKESWLKTPAIIKAFRKIKRKDFMIGWRGPEADPLDISEINEAFPIGFGQTISQPMTVAFMLELLQPQKGQKILDIGSGSGWTTALLSFIAEPGKVIGLEIVPELSEFGKENVEKYGFISRKIAEIILADGRQGYKQEAPYDRILASATAEKIPQAWKDQLKTGGRLVAPVKNKIVMLQKNKNNKFETEEYSGFAFVPLVKK